jgi:hypothetical protein
MPEPFIRDEIDIAEFSVTVGIRYDGTNTVAEIVDDATETLLATGSARRRKGDPRNQALGNGLAVSRAFTSLGTLFDEAGGIDLEDGS